jgi:hypothetical protein
LWTLLKAVTIYAICWSIATVLGTGAQVILGALSIMAILGMANFFTFSAIKRLPNRGIWLASSIGLILIGFPCGLWLGGFFEFQISETMRQIGFPLPLVALVQENGRWIEYVGNPFLYLINIFFLTSISILPISIALILRWLIWKPNDSGPTACDPEYPGPKAF